jgi:hypothetical protein
LNKIERLLNLGHPILRAGQANGVVKPDRGIDAASNRDEFYATDHSSGTLTRYTTLFHGKLFLSDEYRTDGKNPIRL